MKKLLFILMSLPFLVIAQSKQNNILSITTDLNGSFSLRLEENQIDATTILREFNSLVNLSEDHTFEKYYEEDDNLGFTHIKYKQVYKGIPIDGGILIVHTKNNIVSSINGRVLRFDDIDLSVNISKENALEIAKLDLKVTNLIQEYPVETLISSKNNKGESEVQLVHKVKIMSFSPMVAFDVFIDAKTGKIVSKISLSCNTGGTIHTHYNGLQNITCHQLSMGNYVLEDYTRNIGTYDATFSTGFPGGGGPLSANHISSSTSNFIPDPNNGVTVMAGDVHWGMAKTYDFFLNTFGRDSYDNQGGVIYQYINPPDLNYWNGVSPNNAYAVSDGIIGGVSYTAYGLGDGSTMDYVASLDVLAHEFTHNVTAFTSQLIYEEENGALNESFSDILGYAIKNATTGSNTWTIGEELYQNISNPPSPAIMRSLSNPHAKNHPDTYQASADWTEIIPPFDSSNDYGGVHINSGVQNYWFYLLSQGGSGVNDNGDYYSCSGIGINQALEIAYRNLTTYLTPSSIFTDAYTGSLQSAVDLYGISSLQYSAVQDAWNAVGVGIYCDGVTNLTASSGSFTDGSGNANYNRYSDCKWLIDVPGAISIDLSFPVFDTEFGYDGIIVYDGNSINATALDTFSGQSIPPTITSSGSQLLVRFISDAYITSSGWSANYTANFGTNIYGCTDSLACNYNSLATIDDGSCLTVYGCTDSTATNYNPLATCDDGSCNYTGMYTDAIISNVTFGGVGCGGHPTAPWLDFSPWYIISYTLSNSGNLPITSFTIDWPGGADVSHFSTTGSNTISPILPGDSLMPTFKIYKSNGWTNSQYDMVISSVNNEINTNNNIITVYLPTMPICDTIYGCTDSLACNYDPTAHLDDGSCVLPDGCTNPQACNYDPNAICDDGSCILPDGCTDPTACNYDPSATCDDGSCLTDYGCMDAAACNYDASATCDDGSCYVLFSSITQFEDSLYSTVNPSGLEYTAQWLNIDTETGETWLMGEEKSFGPRFDCHYILITTTENDCVDTTDVFFFAEFAGQIYDLKVSPNPTRDLLNIKYVNERNQFVRIYLANSNGVVLDEFISSDNEMNIDISNYPSGVYYVYFSSEEHCSSEEQQISRKIILNK